MESNYYIMLGASPHWAGPSVTKINEPDAFTNRGRVINEIDEPYKFLLEVDSREKNHLDHPALDVQVTGKTLLFSKRLITLLNELGIDNIQYFDANVVYTPTDTTLDYKVANIIGAISGVDINNSELIIDDDIIIEIEKLSFDEDKMSGHKIFRLEESILHIIVHKSIKEAMEASKITGVMFLTDDEFEPGMI